MNQSNMKRRSWTPYRYVLALIGASLVVAWFLFRRLLGEMSDTKDDKITAINRDYMPHTFSALKCLQIDGRCVEYRKVIGRTHGLDWKAGEQLLLDGKPLRIISGSFHYFRTHPAQWIDRLKRAKAAGLNTIMTYIPWNLHEPISGKVFVKRGSLLWDIPLFIEAVHAVGLYLIIRPGPYICAEWELGGLPSWLLHDPNMKLRSSTYKPFLDYVKRYFDKLLPVFHEYTYLRGGPIIAFQIENEFGSYGRDPEYLKFISNLFQSHELNEMFFTSDGAKHLHNGSLEGVFATVNFNKDINKAISTLKEFQPSRPVMVTEFWSGWFDHYGESHHTMSVEDFTSKVDTILSLNCSINFYMFMGGTNFAFYNGANYYTHTHIGYQPTITSYDYNGLVSESGDSHPTNYVALRNLLSKHHLAVTGTLPQMLPNPVRATYVAMTIVDYLSMDRLVSSIKSLKHPKPLLMEALSINGIGGQSYGWILYRLQWPSSDTSATLEIEGMLHDRGLVYVNRRHIATVYEIDWAKNISLSIKLTGLSTDKNILELLVENMGRINYLRLDDQRRGFQGTITLNGKPLEVEVEHIPMEFSESFIFSMGKGGDDLAWTVFDSTKIDEASNQVEKDPSKMKVKPLYPALYRGYLIVPDEHEPLDTHIDMKGWGKGIVMINGFNLGRYWHIGPQRTLYVPAPILKKGKNVVLVFELETPGKYLNTTSNAMLDSPW